MMGYDFHRQKPILDYIVDFYCSELKLAIEIDGTAIMIIHPITMKSDKKNWKRLGLPF
jgi:very-short-patch-repair endonuclease